MLLNTTHMSRRLVNVIPVRVKLILSYSQVIHFINEIFLSYDPQNDNYEQADVTTKEIYLEVCKFTTCFDNKSLASFSKWCSNRKLNFMRGIETRKKRKTTDGEIYVRLRRLYILKDKYRSALSKRKLLCQLSITWRCTNPISKN
ncbi:hypothetical protein DM01DRAFT_1171539 [Hesseltinella vesiculosa]|uniref:Uncharacterized protein n=1 Tax=Hesseltinella vesiculosa TaxID=101127 RepID=A0A1X2G5C2_9FUNG|nr:hypothetical protein DM01DRAFT_1171539 [Hesseltinella vesiculosa]